MKNKYLLIHVKLKEIVRFAKICSGKFDKNHMWNWTFKHPNLSLWPSLKSDHLSLTTIMLMSQIELLLHKWLLNNDHLSINATILGNQRWLFYQYLTIFFFTASKCSKIPFPWNLCGHVYRRDANLPQVFSCLSPLCNRIFIRISCTSSRYFNASLLESI